MTNISALPEPIAALLNCISNEKQFDRQEYLVQFVAAFVDPDLVCNLSQIDALTEEHKHNVLAFFSYCITTGLTPPEIGAMHQFIAPYFHFATNVSPSQ